VSGQLAALRSDLAGVAARVDALEGALTLALQVWETFRAEAAERWEVIEERLRTLREDVDDLRPRGDVDLPSPPRGFEAFSHRLGVQEAFAAELASRLRAVELALRGPGSAAPRR
jgi:hypothetical protein